MLAPVLARLEGISGITQARVDASGRFFWCALDPSADISDASDAVRRILGSAARALPAAEAEAQVARRAHGDPWLTSREVMTLSYVESRVLSVRLAAEVQREAAANAEQREVVAEAIRSALFAAFDRVHGEGGRPSSGWIYDEWPAISSVAAERCRTAIPPDLHRRVEELLPRLMTR